VIESRRSRHNHLMLLSSLLGRLTTTQSIDPSAQAAATGTELVRDHYDFIWRLLRRMGLSAADADDAAQQVFVTTLYPQPKPIRPGSERSFLYGVALNVLREFRRKRAVGLRHSAEPLEQHERSGAPVHERLVTQSPEQAVQRRQAWNQLQQILSTMTEDVRAAFVLYELEGLTVPEIAQIGEVPLGTVASRLRRAREQFSAAMASGTYSPVGELL
jgi:RNA polymerase sigma-70 factor (ECF subfamily)